MAIKPVSGEIKSQDINNNLSYLDSKFDQINGGPKETFTSVPALQSKYPNGANSAMLVTDASGANGYLYTWNGGIWAKGPLYQSQGIADKSITNVKLGKEAVSYDKIENVKFAHDNYYNTANFVDGYYYDAITGTKVTSTEFGNSGYLQLEIGKMYRIGGQKPKDILNRHVTFWDSSDNFISGISNFVFVVPPNTAKTSIAIRQTEKDGFLVFSNDKREQYVFDKMTIANITTLPTLAGGMTKPDWYDGSSIRSMLHVPILIKTATEWLINPIKISTGDTFFLTSGGRLYASQKYSDITLNTDFAPKGRGNVWLYYDPLNYILYITAMSEINLDNSTTAKKINNALYLGIIIDPLAYPASEISIFHTSVISVEYEGRFIPPTTVGSNLYYIKKIHEELNREVSNKKISILGDSISTFNGYIPVDNATFYPTGFMNDVNSTWWKRLLNMHDYLSLLINNSWSGSRVTTTGGVQSSAITRANALHSENEDPDIIIVFIGINDFNNNVLIGDYNASTGTPVDSTKFSEAYAIMLNKMTVAYPKSKIYCCALPFNERGGFPRKNNNGDLLDDYNAKIRIIAKLYGCEVIDLDKTGINVNNANLFYGDGLHPNPTGMDRIYEKVRKTIL